MACWSSPFRRYLTNLKPYLWGQLFRLNAHRCGSGGGQALTLFGGLKNNFLLACSKRIAPIAHGQTATYSHQNCATPNPIDKWVVVDAHAPGAARYRLSQRHVHVAGQAGIDRGFRHDVSRGRVRTFLRVHLPDKCSVLTYIYFGACGLLVWAGYLGHTVEAKLVPTCIYGIAYTHTNVLLGLISGHDNDTNDKYCDTKVGQLHPVITTALHS